MLVGACEFLYHLTYLNFWMILFEMNSVSSSGSTMRLVFAHHDHLYLMDRRGGDQRLVTTTNSAGVDFFYKNKLIFWSDTDTRKVSCILCIWCREAV